MKTVKNIMETGKMPTGTITMPKASAEEQYEALCLGINANAGGIIKAPVHDKKLMAMLALVSDVETLLDAWIAGWHLANAKK